MFRYRETSYTQFISDLIIQSKLTSVLFTYMNVNKLLNNFENTMFTIDRIQIKYDSLLFTQRVRRVSLPQIDLRAGDWSDGTRSAK